MPEPSVMQGKESHDYVSYDRNLDDPYSSEAHQKVHVKHKLCFILAPVVMFALSGRIFLSVLGGCYYSDNHYYGGGVSSWVGFWLLAFPGAQGIKAANQIQRWRGLAPDAFPWRWVLVANGVIHASVPFTAAVRNTWNSEMSEYSDGMQIVQPYDAVTGTITMPWTVSVGYMWINPPNIYADHSAFGVYCCANMPGVRNSRCWCVEAFFCAWMDIYVNQWVYLAGKTKGVMGSVVTLIVFGWKRMLYMMVISLNAHDTVWKGFALMLPWDALLQFNAQLALIGVGSQSVDVLVTFISTDWVIFFMRVCILVRVGSQTCPKLVKWLVEKQLENMPAPFPNHETACGGKIAMRTVQAFLVTLEGETMSTGLMLQLVHAVLISGAGFTTQLVLTVPLKSLWVPCLMLFLDILQDIFASKAAERFSEFSYVYSTSEKSFMGARMRVFVLWKSFFVASYIAASFTAKLPATFTEFEKLIFPTEWFASPPNALHY